jgi:hypothetical protein
MGVCVGGGAYVRRVSPALPMHAPVCVEVVRGKGQAGTKPVCLSMLVCVFAYVCPRRVTREWCLPPTPALAAAAVAAGEGGAAGTSAAPPPAAAYGLWAATTGNQISSRLLSARSANALLELPRASGTLAAGTLVSALLIDDLGAMPQRPGDVPTTPGF